MLFGLPSALVATYFHLYKNLSTADYALYLGIIVLWCTIIDFTIKYSVLLYSNE